MYIDTSTHIDPDNTTVVLTFVDKEKVSRVRITLTEDGIGTEILDNGRSA